MTRLRSTTAGLAIVALGACATDQAGPTALVSRDNAPSLSHLIGYPDLTNRQTFEGDLIVCKDGTPTGTNFNFDFTVKDEQNATVASGTVQVPVGSCVKAADVSPGLAEGNYFASVTEQAPPAYWSLSTISHAYPTGVTVGGVTTDLPTATISGLKINNDFGVAVTFTNTYDPPVGQLGNFVWNDINLNGIQNVGENGIAGATVCLSGAASACTTTNASGLYLFTGLAAGNYVVTVTTPTGFTPTLSTQGSNVNLDSNGSPASATLPTNSSVDLSIDFGYVALPDVGCTLTQGYWKTHGEDWDAAADGFPFTTGSAFYNSGKTYLQIMWTPPAGGNAYLQLAHQFIAARLNVNGGTAGIASVDAALAGAAAYFAAAPAGIPTPSGALRTQLRAWATTLDSFNNGLLGTPHCGAN